VDDDPDLAAALADALGDAGYAVDVAHDGWAGVAALEGRLPDLVLLDIGLPDISGLEVCRRVRAAGITTPILVISGRADLVDVVLGIELGADDDIRKPYNVRELLARVSAQLRRAATPRPQPDGPLELGGLSIDLRGHRVCRDGAEIGLTLTEFNLLALLAARHGDIVSRSEMLTTIWEHTPEVDPRTIDAHIHRLRRKLEQDSPGYCYIDTVPGVGYRFAQPLAAPEAAGLCLVA
jgi:DNA-binding response OmpR family regulator